MFLNILLQLLLLLFFLLNNDTNKNVFPVLRKLMRENFSTKQTYHFDYYMYTVSFLLVFAKKRNKMREKKYQIRNKDVHCLIHVWIKAGGKFDVITLSMSLKRRIYIEKKEKIRHN